MALESVLQAASHADYSFKNIPVMYVSQLAHDRRALTQR